jgi:hypothetical protein
MVHESAVLFGVALSSFLAWAVWCASRQGAAQDEGAGERQILFWLGILDRCWTTERRHRHHLQDDANCNLCGQSIESTRHLLLGCVYSREVWARILRIGLLNLCSAPDAALAPWWLPGRCRRNAGEALTPW